MLFVHWKLALYSLLEASTDRWKHFMTHNHTMSKSCFWYVGTNFGSISVFVYFAHFRCSTSFRSSMSGEFTGVSLKIKMSLSLYCSSGFDYLLFRRIICLAIFFISLYVILFRFYTFTLDPCDSTLAPSWFDTLLACRPFQSFNINNNHCVCFSLD